MATKTKTTYRGEVQQERLNLDKPERCLNGAETDGYSNFQGKGADALMTQATNQSLASAPESSSRIRVGSPECLAIEGGACPGP